MKTVEGTFKFRHDFPFLVINGNGHFHTSDK